MNSENKIILICSKLVINQQQKQELVSLLNQQIDWQLLYKKAGANGVVTFLYYNLKKLDLLSFVPSNIVHNLHSSYLLLFNQTQFLLSELKLLPTASQDIKTIATKGCALNLTLYKDIVVRSMSDIDVLVAKDTCEKYFEDLISSGWKADAKLIYRSIYHKLKYYITYKTLPYTYKGDYKFFIDIHYKFFKGDNDNAVSKLAVETAVPIEDTRLYRLSNEIQLVQLCSNFNGDYKRGVRLRTLADILNYIQTVDINYAEVAKICEMSKSLKQSYDFTMQCINDFDNIELDKLVRPKPEAPNQISAEGLSLTQKIGLAFYTIFPQKNWRTYKFPNSKFSLFAYWWFMFNKHIVKVSQYCPK